MTQACVSAAPQPRGTPPIVTRPRTQLRLVPTPAPGPARRHDNAYATCLALLLVVGALGVLLLNTALQQQSDRISAQQRVDARLTLARQSLRVVLEREADPRMLAARAKALHMGPVARIHWLPVTPSRSSASRR